MKPIQTYPVFTTLAANLRPLSDLKSFVGDVLIDFQRDGLNVHGISMEGQLGFELKLFGNVVFPFGSGDGNFKVSIGIEPSIIASDIKHISSDMEISFTIYNFFSDITKTWVPALCITCDACHHNSKFRPLDVRTNNMTKSPTEYATHFISIRDLHGAITAAKSSRIKAIGLSLSPNHDKLINDIINAVKSGGYLAIQQPYNYDEPIYLLIRETIASSRWKSRINDSRTFYHLRANDYYDLLATRCEDINVWMTTYKHTMPSHEAILDWYRGTGLRPYIQALGDDKESIQEFEKDILDRIVTAYPKQKDGNIIFDFPRLFFTAKVK